MPPLPKRISIKIASGNYEMRNNSTHTVANMEQNSCNAPLAKKKTQRHDSPCRINVLSLRKRLADSDGISAKAAIDGLVHAGILPDDSSIHVESVSYSQEKTKGDEKTIITIEWS